jgi:hypothetical protein
LASFPVGTFFGISDSFLSSSVVIKEKISVFLPYYTPHPVVLQEVEELFLQLHIYQVSVSILPLSLKQPQLLFLPVLHHKPAFGELSIYNTVTVHQYNDHTGYPFTSFLLEPC